MNPTVVRFKNQKVPVQTGERARLKVSQGSDRGFTFVILAERVTIGRAETADVFITDLKSSRLHAEISKNQTGWQVKDLGSANGIAWNGKNTREASLRVGDTLTIGETIFEFYPVESGAALLSAPAKSGSEVAKLHESARAQKQNFKSLLKGGGSSDSAPANSRKTLVILGGLAVVAVLVFSDKKAPTTPSAAPSSGVAGKSVDRGLASYLPEVSNSENHRQAEYFLKIGFREFREENYLRAITNFETVLQIESTHRLARLYLENCKSAIQDHVKLSLSRGKSALDAGKLRESKGHFEAVLRLLYRDQSNAFYLEAKEQLQKVEKQMKAASGGIG